MIRRAIIIFLNLTLLASCARQQSVSETEAKRISAKFATSKFKGANFMANAAQPYDAGTAWVMNYYLPVKQHGGLVTVVVQKRTGEVMVAYSADEPASTKRAVM